MRVTLLHNPTAGHGRHSAGELLDLIRRAGHHVVYQSTDEDEWTEALSSPGDLVVAAGGDGTVDKVAVALAGRGIPLAILPLGTANNVAEALGISVGLPQLIAGWTAARRRAFDLGVARGLQPDGGNETQFVEAIGVGLFVGLIATADPPNGESAGTPEQKLQRDLEILLARLEHSRPAEYRVTLDGADLSGEYLLVEAMNVGTLGPRLPLAPAADPGDGVLDVVFLAEKQATRFADCLRRRGRLDDALSIHRGRELEIRLEGCDAHLDGKLWSRSSRAATKITAPDVWPDVDVRISLHAAALEILVPA